MINQTDNNFLDISKLLSGELEKLSFDFKDIPFPNGDEEIAVSSLHFSGEAKDISGFIRLIGTVTGQYSAPCARCLAPVAREFSIDIDLSVVTAPTESDEDYILAEGQKIDLGSFATDTVLLNLPLRLLCREDCKGLCPKCGKDLNQGDCECDHKEIDPRLAGLADFFKDK
ncbi:MAG: DUF177 domain-containing protein [Clostridia bacterium]|nr:DUF177 domain-containing protein [Clostridia bacterium]